MILLCGVYYIYVSGELTENKKEEMDKILGLEQNYLGSFFDTRILEVRYQAERNDVREFLKLYQDVPDKTNQKVMWFHKVLSEKFENMNKKSKEIQDVFILAFDGTLIASGNPDSYWINLFEREYFQKAMQGETVISQLTKDKIDGKSVIFFSAPVYDSAHQKILGVMVNLIDMKETSEGITNLVTSETGEAYLVNGVGEIVFHKNPDLIGTRPQNLKIAEFMNSAEFQKNQGNKIIKNGMHTVYITFQSVDGTDWKIVLEQDMNLILAEAYQAFLVMLIVFLITISLTIAISIKIANSITVPLTELTKIADRTKEGDLSSRFSYNSKNEYGQLARSFNAMLDELHATEEELRINNEDLEENRKKLEEAQTRYNIALQSARDVIWEWDLVQKSFYASDQWNVLFPDIKYSETIQQVAFEQVLNQEDTITFYNEVQELICGIKEWVSYDFSYRNQNKEKLWYQIKASRITDIAGNSIKLTGTVSDQTFQKETETKIWELAFIDQLTKLPNRTSFKYKMEEELERAEKNGYGVALFLLDLDNFKRINDTLGHTVGDILIIEIADRLKKQNLDVYRFAGDEFAVILSGELTLPMIERISGQIHEMSLVPFQYQERTIMTSFSVGISIYPEGGSNLEKLVQNADTALYIAKEDGKAKSVIFNQIMSEKIMKKLEIETVLRRAIKDKLICMYYQPQFSPEDDRLKAFEALMRIQLEDGTMISPADFIPVAEETGVITEIGEWSIQEVFEQIKIWTLSGVICDYISINVSGIQLRQNNFAEMVYRIAKEKQIKPEQVEIEITESTFMETSDKNFELLNKLKQWGFRIALDDFGTGYSSLQYLRTLPLTTLKIDKFFIDSIDHSKKAESIVRQIIEIGHEMELNVIAEGVEIVQQKDILCRLSCDLIQGYFYSRPLTLKQTKDLMRTLHND